MDMELAKTDGTKRIEELRAFLLGTLAETDVERVEYSLLSDDGLYELLLATEEELIDEYVSGALSQSEASGFLGYLNKLPGGRTRIDFARDFRESLGASETFSQLLRGQRPAWAAAFLLSALAFAIYASMAYREPAPLVLTAGLTRSEGEIPTATLSESTPAFRVMLDLGVQSHDRYRATLYDADSRAILSSEGLTASVTERRILVAFLIPVAGLEPGDYSISLEGETASAGYEPLEKYVFRLIE
jgi:hypothetical protein